MAYFRNSDMVAANNRNQLLHGETQLSQESTGYSSMGVYGTKPLVENFSITGGDTSRGSNPNQYMTESQIPLSTGYYSTDPAFDLNTRRYVGWDANSLGYGMLMSDITVELVSKKCTELLAGVHPEGRPIVFPKQSIINVLDSVYQSHTPRVGDIHSRYIQADTTQRNDVAEMINRAIKIITSQVRNEYEVAEQNSKLTIWTTVYGDFNEHGLRSHPQITQINNRGPNRHQISMRY
jgi:hypothetical protein